MRSSKYFSIFIFVMVGFLLVGEGSLRAQQAPQSGGTLKIAMMGAADTLDPHVTGARRAYSILMNVFDTLVYKDVDGTYKPGLAKSWSWNTDCTLFTFKLQKDVKFHDGTPFDAEAVVFNFNRMVDPKTKSKFAASAVGPYASSRAVDDLTVEVKYNKPIAPTALLDSLSQAYLSMVSPAGAKKWGDNFGRNPIGSGPFIFKEWTAQNRVTLVRNKDYNWASPVFKHNGPAYLDQLLFMTIPEDATRVATLETGESDVVLELSEESVKRFRASGQFQVLYGDQPGCPVIFWMNVEHPILSDIKVRRAMLYGFDANLLANTVYQGLVVPVQGPLGRTTWAYNPAVETMYPYNPKKAGELLDEAGWAMNQRTGIREKKDGTPLKFDLSDLVDKRRGEFFQAKMREIGVAVDVRIVTSDILWQITRQGGTYAMASTWFTYSDPDVLRLLYHSSNIGTGFAISRYRDAKLDQTLVSALGERDAERRKQSYFDLQKEIMSQALIVPVYSRRQHDGLKTNIQNYRLDRGEYPVLYDVYFK